MALCNCFETTPATCKHYQKPFTVCWNKNKRDGRGTCAAVCVDWVKENKNMKKGEKQGKAIISHRHSVHTFHISQFLC